MASAFKPSLLQTDGSGCSILVIGYSRTGKSTLVNELIGTPILLTEVSDDSTRYITRIKNSESFRLQLIAKDEKILEEKTFSSSGNLRDEYRNNVRYKREGVKYIDILMRIPGIKGNNMIIDTQNFGQVGELVDILKDSPPLCAYIIVVDGSTWDCIAAKLNTTFNCLIENITSNKLQTEQSENTKIMFVLNKVDLMREKEATEEAEEMRCALKTDITVTWPYIEVENIFLLSAKHPECGRVPQKEFGKFKNALVKITENMKTVQIRRMQHILTEKENVDVHLTQEYEALKEQIEKCDPHILVKLYETKKWNRKMDVQRLFQKQLSDLTRKECGIVVVGETSAGKTTLINRILRKDIFTPHNLAATATVTRIRHSATPNIKIYTKEETLIKEIPVELSDIREKLDECTDCSKIPESLKDAYYVDVFLPFPGFEGNVILVDTPGIGTNSHLNEVLLDFLPNAGSFIFVIDASASENPSRNNFLGLIRRIGESSHEMPCFDPESVMFLSNKWDLIKREREKQVITTRLEKRLFKEWHKMRSNNLLKVSLKEVIEGKATPYTVEYQAFEKRLKETIVAHQNKRAHTHTRFLDELAKDLCHALDSIIENDARKQGKIRQSLKTLKSIQSYCAEESANLFERTISVKEELAMDLHNYLHCEEGRKDILNPSGSDISIVPSKYLRDKIPDLFSGGVQRWCKGYETKSKIDKIDALIENFQKEMVTRIGEVEDSLEEISIPSLCEVIPSDVREVEGSREENPYKPLCDAVPSDVTVSPLNISPRKEFVENFLSSVLSILMSSAKKELLINELYDKCLESLTLETLKTSFGKSFAEYRCKYLLDSTDFYTGQIAEIEIKLEQSSLEYEKKQSNPFLLRVSLNENLQRIAEIKSALDM